jgi:hypothetical protein
VRAYEIVRGTLADLDRLPLARIPDEIAVVMPARERTGLIPKGKRNNELFKHCRGIVDYCDTLDQLIDAATTWADDRLSVPLSVPEIIRTCQSVWRYRGGQRKVVHQMLDPEQYARLLERPEIFGVFAYLAAENGPNAEFMIADGLAKARGWSRRLVPAARGVLLRLGIIKCVSPSGKNAPALYRWINLDIPNLVGNP